METCNSLFRATWFACLFPDVMEPRHEFLADLCRSSHSDFSSVFTPVGRKARGADP
jgi:hypothetical protein